MSSKAKAKDKKDSNKTTKETFKKESFIEKQWTEQTEGEYDEDGFFVTPNGSFWDPDGVYFNKDGFDKHGGRYDLDGVYIPGEGWNEKNNCYESEIEDYDGFDEQEAEFGDNMDKIDDDDNLDDDVFESDFKNDDNFNKLFEDIKIDDNKEKQNYDLDENKIQDEEKDNENKENNNDDEKKSEKSNEKDSNEQKKPKIIITRENQDKYLDDKMNNDIQKNNVSISIITVRQKKKLKKIITKIILI